MLEIPAKIQYVLDKLGENGYEAYIVGGCVRDALLGLTPHDYDVTTSAKPEEVIAIFDHTVPTGIKHGTVTVIVENEPVEVTTFRTEGEYSDSRRPDSVEFVSNLKEDLSRRDFTVNAFAYCQKTGLKDYFGGMEDLQNKILRAVGDPEKRFREDALRILRLFRFASQLDFEIESGTYTAALNLSGTLENISRERIFVEILKAITGKKPESLAPLINVGGLKISRIEKSPDFDSLQKLKNNENLCLFAFLYETSDDPLAVLRELKSSNAHRQYTRNLLNLCELPLPKTKEDIKNALFLSTPGTVTDWIFYLKAKGQNTDTSEKLLEEVLNNNEPYSVPHLAIDGNTLRALGYKGREVGDRLEILRKAVIENPDCNKKEILLEILKSL